MNNVTVVLFEPQDDINIGSVVRACANFGVTDLRLIRPASADAERVLISAPNAARQIKALRRFDGPYALDEALSDCMRVFGATSRARAAARAVMTPVDVGRVGQSFDGRIALMFGREDHGLPNEALDRCDVEVTIPTAPEYRSLNLAQAVLLMLWEQYRARTIDSDPAPEPQLQVRSEFSPAERGQVERMFETAADALKHSGFIKYGDGEHVMRSVRSVLNRAQLDERELAIWFGIFKEVLSLPPRDD